MRPAPPYTKPMKTRAIALTLSVSLAAAANTWPAQPPLGSLLACRSIQNDTARLACFDRESATIAPMSNSPAATTQTAPGAMPPPAMTQTAPVGSPSAATAAATIPASPPVAAITTAVAATAVPPAAPLDPVATFGLSTQTVAARETAAGLRKKDLQSITAHISRISSAKSGRMVFDLDNHQVWQQMGAEGDLMAKPGDEVKIWRAMMGSFWLQASTGRGCKVTRLE